MSNIIGHDKRIAVLDALSKGVGARATARMIGVSLNTVLRYKQHPDGEGKLAFKTKRTVSKSSAESPASKEARESRELARREMISRIRSVPGITKTRVFSLVAKYGLPNSSLGVLLKNAVYDKSRGLNLAGDIKIPVARKSYPELDRRPIDYEASTDIKYLTKNRSFLSLDDRTDYDRFNHETIAGDFENPAEALMAKEEYDEYLDVSFRRTQFSRWEKSNSGLVRVGDFIS